MRAAQEESDAMLVALVCLWIGFAIGFLCAAMLHGGRRTARDELDDGRALAGIRIRH